MLLPEPCTAPLKPPCAARNLIATDDRTFSLILLCWNPQRFSPIHDHPCDGCWMRGVEGTVQEVRYSTKAGADGSLAVTGDTSVGEGEVAYVDGTWSMASLRGTCDCCDPSAVGST